MMFWRLLRRMIVEGRGRLAVALVALVSGATVSAALLNLEFDAERKFTRELRTLGPNVLIKAAATAGSHEESGSVFQSEQVGALLAGRSDVGGPRVTALAPFLYVIARAGEDTPLVVAGTWLDQARRLGPWWQIEGDWVTAREDRNTCLVGRQVATRFLLRPGSPFEVRYVGRRAPLRVAGIVTTGGSEDDHVFVNLPVAQDLAGMTGKLSLVQMSVTGAPEQVERFATQLSAALPGLSVRPLRQIAQAEGQLLARLHALLFWSVGLILVLTSLCLLATMAALAVERRADVGLMKALGGQVNRVVGLFLAEAGLLGATGGVFGAILGTVLSAWIGRRVFGAAIAPRPEVFPLTVAVMIAVALLGALPLRLLGRVRPAEVLRGGE